jgi:membrane protein YdbS with pleckstrin-like domain
MQCKKCQQDAPEGSAFCPKCGASLTNDHDPAVAQRVATAAGRGRSPAEDEIWSGCYSPKAMAGSFLGAALLTIVGLAVAIFTGPPGWIVFAVAALVMWGWLIALYFYRRFTVRYRLTTFRFFHESGLLSRTSNRVEVIDIDDVTVHQNVIERMFDVGTVEVASSDTTHPSLSLFGVEDPRHIADLIDGARRAERQRRGLHLDAPLVTE